MTAHAITIDTLVAPVPPDRYRWRCSCRRVGKRWTSSIRRARNGGARHVAMLERGRG